MDMDLKKKSFTVNPCQSVSSVFYFFTMVA